MAKDKRTTIADFVDRLGAGDIHETSRRVDWSEIAGPDCNGYRAFSVDTCRECGKHVYSDGQLGETRHDYIDDESRCEGYLNFSEPMMNFFYPCSFYGMGGVEGAAYALDKINTCCIVIEMEDGETGFALAGGGMDLSWDIAGAYVACGQLPPLDKTELPEFAGNTLTAHKRRVLAACIKSHEIAKEWSDRKIDRIKHLRRAMGKNKQARRKAA